MLLINILHSFSEENVYRTFSVCSTSRISPPFLPIVRGRKPPKSVNINEMRKRVITIVRLVGSMKTFIDLIKHVQRFMGPWADCFYGEIQGNEWRWRRKIIHHKSKLNGSSFSFQKIIFGVFWVASIFVPSWMQKSEGLHPRFVGVRSAIHYTKRSRKTQYKNLMIR